MTESPFTLARFEYEQEHLYYLQRRLFARLERPKPVYLVGSRGTGKTTLLKALSWSERANNASLSRQLKSHRARYLGIYLKLPEIQLGLVSRWASAAGEDVQANIFSHYLDLIWLEELVRGIAELLISGEGNISANVEREHVDAIYANFLKPSVSPREAPKTLRELGTVLRQRRERIEMSASTALDVRTAVERLHLISHIGSFGRDVADQLAKLCNSAARPEAKRPGLTFKVCLDEGECLDQIQLRTVNTMIRLSKAPLFFVISFVSNPVDLTSTLISNLSLQQADREFIRLDEMSSREFQDLVEGVASVRIQHVTGRDEFLFSSQQVLGELDINSMLVSILRESVSPIAKRLLAAAESAAKSWHASDITQEGIASSKRKNSAPPIYQTYLVERLGLARPRRGDQIAWLRRKQDSAELRKRIVAAYLGICDEIRMEPRYAYAEIVLQTSDNCVRDFLGQLDEIFQLAGMPLARFLRGPVDVRIQDEAIKSASRKKYESLPMFGVNNPTETRALVDALARLTSLLQRRSVTDRNLKSSERGLFSVDIGDRPDRAAKSLALSLREAAEAGFLRIVDSNANPINFRVHTSLAPMYGFSYRGAYYKVPLQWRALNQLRAVKESVELESHVVKLYGELEKIDNQSDLFEGRLDA